MDSKRIADLLGPMLTQWGGVPAPVAQLAFDLVQDIRAGNYTGAAQRLFSTVMPLPGMITSLLIGYSELRGMLKDVKYALEKADRARYSDTVWHQKQVMALRPVMSQECGVDARGRLKKCEQWIQTKVSIGVSGPLQGAGLMGQRLQDFRLGFGVKWKRIIPNFVAWRELVPGEAPTSELLVDGQPRGKVLRPVCFDRTPTHRVCVWK